MTAQIITTEVTIARLKSDIHGIQKGATIRLLPFCGKLIFEEDLSKKNKRIVPNDKIEIVQ